MGGMRTVKATLGNTSPPAVLLASQMEQSWGGRSSSGNCATLRWGAHLERTYCFGDYVGTANTAAEFSSPRFISQPPFLPPPVLSLLTCIEKWGRGWRHHPSVVTVSFVLANPVGARVERKNKGYG